MTSSSRVREALDLFSVDVGLEQAVAEQFLCEMLSIPGMRDEIRRELEVLEESESGPASNTDQH